MPKAYACIMFICNRMFALVSRRWCIALFDVDAEVGWTEATSIAHICHESCHSPLRAGRVHIGKSMWALCGSDTMSCMFQAFVSSYGGAGHRQRVFLMSCPSSERKDACKQTDSQKPGSVGNNYSMSPETDKVMWFLCVMTHFMNAWIRRIQCLYNKMNNNIPKNGGTKSNVFLCFYSLGSCSSPHSLNPSFAGPE